MAYNSILNELTGITPFKVNHGRELELYRTSILGKKEAPQALTTEKNIKMILETLKKNL